MDESIKMKMNPEILELNGKKVTLENITLEDVEQLFDFDKTILLQHRLELSKEYIDTHFPENENLFKRLQKSIKRNIKLTDPKTFKSPAGVITYSQLASKDLVNEDNERKKKLYLKRKDTVKKIFGKKQKKKTLLDEKVEKLNKDLKKTGMN
jgi:hypothetical protein